MAQYLKAFSRKSVFPSVYVSRDGEGSGEGTGEGTGEGSGDLRITHPRLIRRSEALLRNLQKSGAADVVTSLGKTLFGLDVLEGVELSGVIDSKI